MLKTSFICIIDQHADVYQNLFKQKHKECKGLFLRTGAHKRLSGCEHNTNELIEKAMVQLQDKSKSVLLFLSISAGPIVTLP